jgi:IS6 family transposase
VCKPRPAPFKWRHFEPAIILCAVGWYLRYSLSYRDVEELVTERGLPADHTTIWRWVQRYASELNKRCRRELKPTNGSWRVDETYIPVAGEWHYLYRAVDSTGATIDFWLSAERDAAAAKRFFPEGLAGSWSSAAARNQRRRQPFLSEGRGGAEARAETGSPLPLSNP